jgi:hypothetical protein
MKDDAYAEMPVYTKYMGLTEVKLLKLTHSPDGIERDGGGKINTIFLYNDATNPQSYPQHWLTLNTGISILRV